jgi:SNF family Na+-dependent transporter
VQAETIELLSVKGKFTTEQAVIVAAAIDMGIEKAQLVTVPILDARLATVDARFASLEARLASLEVRLELKMQRWAVKVVIAMLVGQTALGPIGLEAFSSLRQALSTLVR